MSQNVLYSISALKHLWNTTTYHTYHVPQQRTYNTLVDSTNYESTALWESSMKSGKFNFRRKPNSVPSWCRFPMRLSPHDSCSSQWHNNMNILYFSKIQYMTKKSPMEQEARCMYLRSNFLNSLVSIILNFWFHSWVPGIFWMKHHKNALISFVQLLCNNWRMVELIFIFQISEFTYNLSKCLNLSPPKKCKVKWKSMCIYVKHNSLNV